jgi:N-acetylmuramoyl-L-alanine amidase
MNLISIASPNFDSRNSITPSIIVMHYTGMKNGPMAIDRLCDPSAKVSSHYVVEQNGRIFQLVDEKERAWHAGMSAWRGISNLNSHSIGIEIVNSGHEFGYHPFPHVQMQSVLILTQDIITRHTIMPRNVVGHSDIAPTRKMDPGELFDWEWLALHGVGQPVPVIDISFDNACLLMHQNDDDVRRVQSNLKSYGYDINITGIYDTETQNVVMAFQRHFRRSCVNGIADKQTQAVLEALLTAVG